MSTYRIWTKRYDTASVCQTAAANYRWLADLGLPVPALRTVGRSHLDFAHFTGRHAHPTDLPALARLLGEFHHSAYRAELHRARLNRPHRTASGLVIPDFLTRRGEAVRTRLESGVVPPPAPTTTKAINTLEAAVGGPACLYKDSNPRNYLIGPDSTVAVDFDALTLAPFGYDLAKLVVSLAMTHGPHVTDALDTALDCYNRAITSGGDDLPAVPRSEFIAWASIHHVLTSPYLGRTGYRHTWCLSE